MQQPNQIKAAMRAGRKAYGYTLSFPSPWVIDILGQIDFDYVESLAALFQQVFVSAVVAARQGANRSHGRDYLSVPRVDIEYPISVAVDLMTERVVTMFMPGTPFQASYSMPVGVARMLSGDLLNACEQVEQPLPAVPRLAN